MKKGVQLFKLILNFFFPITCVCCGKHLPFDDVYRICPKCFDEIELIKGLFCKKCGKVLPDGGEHCYFCRKKPQYNFEYIRSTGEYKGLLRKLIHLFKYKNSDYLDKLFARLMIYTVEKENEFSGVDLIVPVPIHWTKRIKRGFNQSELLAKRVAVYLERPLLKNILIRKKRTKSQYNLKREDRFMNLKDSFVTKNSDIVRNKKILLIDDISTTCATINECSRALRQAGSSGVFALTLARD
ncbi:ComF family protein [Elusimicrobiota bacterium]